MELVAGNKGLVNLGNTCYMNSALQCLSHLLEFHPMSSSFIKSCNLSDATNNVMDQWIELQRKLWDNGIKDPINPTELLREFRSECGKQNRYFDNFQQNDIDEFLNIFMDFLHEAVSKPCEIKDIKRRKSEPEVQKIVEKSNETWKSFFKKNNSYIIDKFYSQYFSLTSCPECEYITTNHDPFSVITLTIPPNASNLYDCLINYTNKKKLDSENEWRCDECKQLTTANQKIMFWNTSDIIIILLKRYTFSLDMKRAFKNNQEITYPFTLDLSDYSINHNKQSTEYQLCGMCIHSGDTGGGHYYAICKHSLDEKWRVYNDSSVFDIEESELSNHSPYCFFYRRIK